MMGILRNIKTIVLLLAVLTLVEACKESGKINVAEKENTSVYYFIRHAEKDRSDPTNKNPSLTIQGLERANKWAVFFKDKNIAAVYSTNYIRTRQTALPIAKEQNIEIINYTTKELISEKFIANNKGKNIVIVGHSNTTPELVNSLLGEKKYKDIADSENNNLFIVTLNKNKTTAKREKVN
ncbi:histidine phosphatase family protein [Flavobacteriaceae bacterium]|nr:histidine phosphatase family protein [Flavobacteriaceae bacterium]